MLAHDAADGGLENLTRQRGDAVSRDVAERLEVVIVAFEQRRSESPTTTVSPRIDISS